MVTRQHRGDEPRANEQVDERAASTRGRARARRRLHRAHETSRRRGDAATKPPPPPTPHGSSTDSPSHARVAESAARWPARGRFSLRPQRSTLLPPPAPGPPPRRRDDAGRVVQAHIWASTGTNAVRPRTARSCCASPRASKKVFEMTRACGWRSPAPDASIVDREGARQLSGLGATRGWTGALERWGVWGSPWRAPIRLSGGRGGRTAADVAGASRGTRGAVASHDQRAGGSSEDVARALVFVSRCAASRSSRERRNGRPSRSPDESLGRPPSPRRHGRRRRSRLVTVSAGSLIEGGRSSRHDGSRS